MEAKDYLIQLGEGIFIENSDILKITYNENSSTKSYAEGVFETKGGKLFTLKIEKLN